MEEENIKKYLLYVFTEQGVAMLATVLRTGVAFQMTISIMRAFVTMRKHISNSLIQQKYINGLVLENNDLIKEHDKNKSDGSRSQVIYNNTFHDKLFYFR